MGGFCSVATVAIKYMLIFIMAFYVFYSFTRAMKDAGIFQKALVYMFHFFGSVIIYMKYPKDSVLIFYVVQLIFLIFLMHLFPVFYENAKKNLLCHMAMLLSISFLIMERLDLSSNDTMLTRQFVFLCVGFICMCILPWIYNKIKHPEKYGTVAFLIGILAILVVLVLSATTYGAKLSLTIGPITIQPSEFVKLTYVYFLASYLSKHHDWNHIVKSAILAGSHLIILVLSKDLGATLIFGMTYLIMIYCATGKKRLLFGGSLIGLSGAVTACMMFSHVKERVQAWIDPWSVIDDVGYQVAQSLFAIGTGGFLGSGLFEGSPDDIPVVYKDFIFSAIAEEFGGFFAILLIFLYFNCFVTIVIIGMRQTKLFAKLMICGFATLFATQVILTIGGNIKLIPSTGVTLPLISYGGSSLMSVIFMFGMIQALAICSESNLESNIDGEMGHEAKKKEKKKSK